MINNRWSEEEIELIRMNKPNEEIARKTGRTVTAVRKMRYAISRGYTPTPIVDIVVPANPNKEMTQEEKILRIKELARKYHVRLKEE